VGFDAARNDVVTVQDMAFEADQPEKNSSLSAKLLSRVEGSPELLKYASLLTALFITLAFGVRPAVRGAFSAAGVVRKPGAAELQNEAALSLAEPVALDPERRRTQEVLENVAKQLKKEPAQSSRLLQSWIHSE
jgi:flagellar M-ring protein FliF